MLPSSRTPEGDPVRCPMCGSQSRVDTSMPPGDAVCPVCGAHLWVDSPLEGIEQTKAAIRSFISELEARVAKRDFSEETCRYLVSGVTNSLAAYGTTLWTARTGFLPFLIRKPRLKCQVGPVPSWMFAAEVIFTRRAVQRRSKVAGSPCWRLGVPLLDSYRVIGAIEVIQRDVESQVVRCGFLRFLSQIAQTAAPLARQFD